MTTDNPERAVIEYVPPPPGSMLPVARIKADVDAMHRMVDDILVEGVDYGIIPGVKDKVLLKPGAEKVFKMFSCRPEFIRLPESEIDYTRLFAHYAYKCRAVHAATEFVLSEGEGMCSTAESKYALRYMTPECPACGHELQRSKHDPEWYCWRKHGGCGATYPLAQFEGQTGKRAVTAEEWADTLNTVMKMAQKRAMVACALTLGAVSSIFTQDMEDEAAPARSVPAPDDGDGDFDPGARFEEAPPAAKSGPQLTGGREVEDLPHVPPARTPSQRRTQRPPVQQKSPAPPGNGGTLAPVHKAVTMDEVFAHIRSEGMDVEDVAAVLECEATETWPRLVKWVQAEKGRTVKQLLEMAKERKAAATPAAT
jgi:hypothetical protein